MALLDDFREFQTTASNERPSKTNTGGVVSTSYASVGSFKCLYWEGSAAEAFVSDRFKDKTDAAIAVYPGTNIEKNDRITVGGESYHALSKPQNVGLAGEVTTVALELRS